MSRRRTHTHSHDFFLHIKIAPDKSQKCSLYARGKIGHFLVKMKVAPFHCGQFWLLEMCELVSRTFCVCKFHSRKWNSINYAKCVWNFVLRQRLLKRSHVHSALHKWMGAAAVRDRESEKEKRVFQKCYLASSQFSREIFSSFQFLIFSLLSSHEYAEVCLDRRTKHRANKKRIIRRQKQNERE